MYSVYIHINKINQKVYVGMTSRIPAERWGHNGNNYRTSPHFYNAIQKYGWDNFDHEVLHTNLTKEEACQKEQEYIERYNSTDNRFGYNCTTGGELFHLNELAKEKISEALQGNQNGLGHPCSEEKKRKISEAQKGKHLSEEHKRNLSIAAKKRKSPPCSDEKKRKLSENYPHKRKVYCVELNTIYDSVHDCARQLNLWATTISKVCLGKASTTGGYHFKYYDDTINA